ncbi:hypothetical protein A8F94_17210 [Bacillus sp. FJAT-27225]|uniref:hypothetical protein n=1 Tax=Bacillus sp. FJAT-27225 TaxID=1743144 RepID=UPI00080C22A7|nr:hypothetical protein [Bacillus sp. FJAT-27225]OCA84438.1 hypothetical protein A8F94_17210 [Bacillus sp. FJAT-27225]
MKVFSRIIILTGHFGSGKTELALNFTRNGTGRRALADLDVINPYFRSRDIAATLNEIGVELIGPTKRLASSDLPIVSGELYRVIHDPSYNLIIDAGGEKDGATVLGQYVHEWRSYDISMIFVLNARRPYVSSVEGVIEAISGIEKAARLPINGIINNTNLGAETAIEDIVAGEQLAKAVARKLGISFIGSTIDRRLASCPEFAGRDDIVFIDRFMKLPWE